MPASGPRSRGARAHPPPHQGRWTLARRSATSGLRRSRRQSRHDLCWSAPTSRRLRLATQNLGGITGRGTGYSRAVSRRLRIAVVAAVALAAAGGVALGAVLVRDSEEDADRPSGVPPFVVDLGVRTDPEAAALRQAARAYSRGERRRAAWILARRMSLQARVGAALATWPVGSRARLEQLAQANPNSGAVLFHLGLARYWEGDREGAVDIWRTTRT